MASNSLILRITHPDGSKRESVLEEESVILGSGPGAQLRVPDPTVSNLHVMLKVHGNTVTAIDLGSERGTRLRDEPIRNPVALSSGDVLRIGESEVEVCFPDPLSPLAKGLAGTDFARPAAISSAPALARAGLRPVAPLAVARKLEPVPDAPGPGRLPSTALEEKVWRLLLGPLPEEAKPTERARVLQASLVWRDQIVEVVHLAATVPLTLGAGRRAVFQLAAPGLGEGFCLARVKGPGLWVAIPEGAELTVHSAGEPLSAAALERAGRLRAAPGAAASVELAPEERAQVRVGDVSVLLRLIRPTERLKVQRVSPELAPFLLICAGCFFFAGLIGLWGALRPSRPRSPAEILENQAQYVRLIMKPEPKHPKAKAKAREDAQGLKEGERAKGDEGKAGKPDASKAEAERSRSGAPSADKRLKDAKRIRSLGLLGALSQGAGASVFGPGGLGSGLNSALGGLKARAGTGDARGVGGLGTRGSGVGGGGLGLGVAGLGTQGMGAGRDGYGNIDLGGKSKDSTRIIPGKTTVVGGLDKDVIARIIRQHQSEIRYCFEVELQKNPSLSGKVAVTFIIDGTGAVSDANVAESSLGDTGTEQCMLAKIKRWRFPTPVGGGIVTVNFPWVFKPAGA